MAARIPWVSLTFEKDEDGERVALGAGSFGTVYGASYSHMQTAVKQFGVGTVLSPAALVEIEREAALQSRLAHENVVRVYGLAVDDRPPRPKYGLVMARLHESLSSLLTRAAAGNVEVTLPLPW